MFSLNQWCHLSLSLLLCFLFIFLEIWMFLFWVDAGRRPEEFHFTLLFNHMENGFYFRSADENISQHEERKSDRWEMSTLSKTKVPQVWTPIIYSRPSNPCQRAVSLWSDLSGASLSALTGTTRPLRSTMYSSLSAASFLSCSISPHLYFSISFTLCSSCSYPFPPVSFPYSTE